MPVNIVQTPNTKPGTPRIIRIHPKTGLFLPVLCNSVRLILGSSFLTSTYPHWGQFSALSEIIRPHSGHFINAIKSSFPLLLRSGVTFLRLPDRQLLIGQAVIAYSQQILERFRSPDDSDNRKEADTPMKKYPERVIVLAEQIARLPAGDQFLLLLLLDCLEACPR